MAKIRNGALAGQISGSVGGLTFAHNRGGAYVRMRSIPTIKTSTQAMAAKNRFSLESSAWADLSDAQRLSWASWAANYPITDAFGEKRILTGHQAYVGINSRLNLAGDAEIDAPPAISSPDGLLTLTETIVFFDCAFTVFYTATPLTANQRLWCYGCILPHEGINYIQNRLKFVGVSGKAQTSPWNWETQFYARCGTPAVGQIVVAFAMIFDSTSGLLSTPLQVRQAAVTT